VAAGAHGARGFHVAEDTVRLDDVDAHEQRAVVHDECVTNLHISHETIVVDRCGFFDGGFGAIFTKLDGITIGQRDWLD
jgi:hypothetical protein